MEESAPRKIAQSKDLVLHELENLYSEILSGIERTELIAEIDRAILRSTFSPSEVLAVIVQKCLSKIGCHHGQVVEYRRNRLVVTASSDSTRIGYELPLHRSLCGLAIKSGTTQHCPDLKLLPNDSYVRFHDETASELVVLVKPELSQRTLGILDLERSSVGEFDSTDIAFAELLARQTAIALTHTQTWKGAKILYGISTSLLSGQLSLEKSYQAILESILEGFDFEHGQILRVLGNAELVILASSSNVDIGLRLQRHNSVCGRYLLAEQGRDILVINDITTSAYSDYYLGLLHAEGQPMRSEMIIPLVDNGRVIGALNIEDTQPGVFSDFEQNLLGSVGGLMASAISATFSQRGRLNRARTNSANLALTQLGHVAQSFLHRFSGNIGNARGKLLELNDALPAGPMGRLRGGTIPVSDFIADVTASLSSAADALAAFSDRFNPNNRRFALRELDLEDVAKIALEQARAKYSSERIAFEFLSHIPESRAREDIRGNSLCFLTEQVYEVIENLLNNAVEAIRQRGANFSGGLISMILDCQDPFSARLSISDNGTGISESDRLRVFEIGFTTNKSRQSLGIGLSFCQLYVLQRGGQISCKSRLGEGSTFEVTLPTVLAEGEILTENIDGVKG